MSHKHVIANSTGLANNKKMPTIKPIRIANTNAIGVNNTFNATFITLPFLINHNLLRLNDT